VLRVALLGLVGTSVGAQEAVDTMAVEGSGRPAVVVGAELGAGGVGGDVALMTTLGVGVETEPFALHFEAPLTLRLVDLPPPSDPSLPPICAVVRCEEWLAHGQLSPTSLSRVLDDARFGRPGQLVHARAGAMRITMGQGQLVAGATNAADWDRRKSGAFVNVAVPFARLEAQAVVASLVSPQELFAARVASSPLAPFVGGDGAGARLLSRGRVGLEIAGDAVAPVGRAIDGTGDVLPSARTRPIVGAATDLAWPLLDDELALQITPFVGASALTGLSDGVGAPASGAGVQGGASLELDAIVASARLGGRVLVDGPAHRSGVFSLLYDVERRRAARAGGKFHSTGIADLPVRGGVGGSFEADVDVLDLVRLGGRLHLDPTADARLLEGYVDVGIGGFVTGVRAQQRAFVDSRDVAFGDHTFVVLEASWTFLPPLTAFARWRHAPRFTSGGQGTVVGDPSAADDAIIGVAVTVALEPTS
jgi:hypothetical protein